MLAIRMVCPGHVFRTTTVCLSSRRRSWSRRRLRSALPTRDHHRPTTTSYVLCLPMSGWLTPAVGFCNPVAGGECLSRATQPTAALPWHCGCVSIGPMLTRRCAGARSEPPTCPTDTYYLSGDGRQFDPGVAVRSGVAVRWDEGARLWCFWVLMISSPLALGAMFRVSG